MLRAILLILKLKGSVLARRKRNFIKGRLRWKLVGSLCAGAAFGPPRSAAVCVVFRWLVRAVRVVEISFSPASVLSYAVLWSPEGVSRRWWRLHYLNS